MPAEKIASVIVTDDHAYTRSFHVVWGDKGAAPLAPDGWVNAGFAQIQIREDHGDHGSLAGLDLFPDEVDRLIKVLKRIKRHVR